MGKRAPKAQEGYARTADGEVDPAAIRDEYAVRAQRMLWPLVGRLQEAEDTLDAILALMPESPEDMLGPHDQADLMLEVEGAIFFILNDDLRPMIAGLKRLATVTPADVTRHREVVQLRQVN